MSIYDEIYDQFFCPSFVMKIIVIKTRYVHICICIEFLLLNNDGILMCC